MTSTDVGVGLGAAVAAEVTFAQRTPDLEPRAWWGGRNGETKVVCGEWTTSMVGREAGTRL